MLIHQRFGFFQAQPVLGMYDLDRVDHAPARQRGLGGRWYIVAIFERSGQAQLRPAYPFSLDPVPGLGQIQAMRLPHDLDRFDQLPASIAARAATGNARPAPLMARRLPQPEHHRRSALGKALGVLGAGRDATPLPRPHRLFDARHRQPQTALGDQHMIGGVMAVRRHLHDLAGDDGHVACPVRCDQGGQSVGSVHVCSPDSSGASQRRAVSTLSPVRRAQSVN